MQKKQCCRMEGRAREDLVRRCVLVCLSVYREHRTIPATGSSDQATQVGDIRASDSKSRDGFLGMAILAF